MLPPDMVHDSILTSQGNSDFGFIRYDGWALEDSVPNPASEAETDTCQVFVNVVGWEDVEAHMRFQGSEDFEANIHHEFGMKEMLHTELFHVSLLTA